MTTDSCSTPTAAGPLPRPISSSNPKGAGRLSSSSSMSDELLLIGEQAVRIRALERQIAEKTRDVDRLLLENVQLRHNHIENSSSTDMSGGLDEPHSDKVVHTGVGSKRRRSIRDAVSGSVRSSRRLMSVNTGKEPQTLSADKSRSLRFSRRRALVDPEDFFDNAREKDDVDGSTTDKGNEDDEEGVSTRPSSNNSTPKICASENQLSQRSTPQTAIAVRPSYHPSRTAAPSLGKIKDEEESLRFSVLMISRKDYKQDVFLRDILPTCVENPPKLWPVNVSCGVPIPADGGIVYVLVNGHTPKKRSSVHDVFPARTSSSFSSVIPDAEAYCKIVSYAIRCDVLPFHLSDPSSASTEIRFSPVLVKQDIQIANGLLALDTLRVIVKAQRTGGFHALTPAQATDLDDYLKKA